MKTKLTLLITLLFISFTIRANVYGVVLDDTGTPLPSANIYWAYTTQGTTSDEEGNFSLPIIESTDLLVVSYMGFHSDTITCIDHQNLTVVLVSDTELDEVVIAERKTTILKSRTSAFESHTISADELCKAACCNLSESFETSASVDVSYSDAATGAKQIRLLGLSGTYVQLLSENTPGVRGLASSFGLEYIPGPWMESIQVSKGTSSVINGYEATTGQINVEYLKPQRQDPLSINLMLNSELHAELNIEGGWNINDKLSTGILAHYQNGLYKMDDNGDSFLDMPTSHQLNLLNRWYYKSGNYTFQFLVRGIYDRRIGGQPSVIKHHNETTIISNPYVIDLKNHRIDGFMKNGYIFDKESSMSIGIITAASYHDQNNSYGNKLWRASQTNAYLNAIFQTNFEDRKDADCNEHKLSAGISTNFDRYVESLTEESSTFNIDLNRMEVTPGIFAEYSYRYEDILSIVAGVRGDYSTKYGFFGTPRFNIRYAPWHWWNIRASVGVGYRSPNILADNAFVMPSARTIVFDDTHFNMEQALNTGASMTFYIPLGTKELQLSGEYYYTHFFDCVVADRDIDSHEVHFYNLSTINGRSFAQSFQVEASMTILRGWTMTLAYRQTDVKQTYNGVLREKPLTNKFKGIITTSYQTPLKTWQFDFTTQFNGGGRMPNGFTIPNGSRQYTTASDGTVYYRWYPQLMAQITKYFRTCSLYVGAENMTNFKQDTPVVSADDPWSADFDASMAWGPIQGWKIYAGFRWSLTHKDD